MLWLCLAVGLGNALLVVIHKLLIYNVAIFFDSMNEDFHTIRVYAAYFMSINRAKTSVKGD